MGTGRSEPHGVASWNDLTWQRLYDYVASLAVSVPRDDASATAGISHTLATGHLDTLAEARLLTTTYARPVGRGGPGAGGPTAHRDERRRAPRRADGRWRKRGDALLGSLWLRGRPSPRPGRGLETANAPAAALGTWVQLRSCGNWPALSSTPEASGTFSPHTSSVWAAASLWNGQLRSSIPPSSVAAGSPMSAAA